MACLVVLAGTASSGPQALAGSDKPWLSGEVSTELQADWNSVSTAGSAVNLEATADADVTAHLSDYLSLVTKLKLESFFDPTPGRGRFLQDVDLLTEQLYLEFAHEPFRVQAGKIEIPFGIAWDLAYGLYGSDLAEDYEIEDQIGMLVEFALSDEIAGGHKIAAAAFFADTTFLGAPLFSQSQRLRHSDGGLTNTGQPSSFALAAYGHLSDTPDTLGYFTSVSLLQAGRGTTHDQTGISGALHGNIDLMDDLSMAWLSEVVFLHNAEGEPHDRLSATLSSRFDMGDIWLAPSVSHARQLSGASGHHGDFLATITVGWDINDDATISAGYRFLRKSGLDIHTLGISAQYAIGF